MDKDEDGTNRPDGIVSQARPTPHASQVMVPIHAFQIALFHAERMVNELMIKMQGIEEQRDNYARLFASMQVQLDNLKSEHMHRTAHVRELQACRGG